MGGVPCFSSPAKATAASLGVPRLPSRGYLIDGQHASPRGAVPQLPESLAPGTCFYSQAPLPRFPNLGSGEDEAETGLRLRVAPPAPATRGQQAPTGSLPEAGALRDSTTT